MQENLVNALRSQRARIRERWETLLHAEPVTTPLADPDALVHLMEWTLGEIFRDLTAVPSRRRQGRRPTGGENRPSCPCGLNPLLAYFAVGEQVMREALVLAQAAASALDPLDRDASLVELDLVLHQIARREIESFCGVCQYRNAVPCAASAAPTPSSRAVLAGHAR
ncbi:MAG TPA: hypothetical protein VHO24_19120 [Opitutaceae bacterium]|nr:hypothetical protein [Opitutaceae bacterium]